MHSWKLLEMRYFSRGLSKILWKSRFCFCFWIQSQKAPGATFNIAKCVQKSFSSAVHDLNLFDPLIQINFCVFLKIKVSDVFRGCWKWDIFQEDYQKSFESLDFVFVFESNLKKHQELLLILQNVFRSLSLQQSMTWTFLIL